MADLMDEVGEDLRRQQLEQFWKENGSWIIAGVIIAILFTGGLAWWRQYAYERNLKQTAELVAMMEEADAGQLAAFAAKSTKDHGALARFAAAAIYAKRKESDKAVALYRAIADTTGLDRVYRDLARLLSVGQRLQTGDPKALHGELEDLTGPKSAWRHSALEMEALLYAREKRMKEAADALAEITGDISAPSDIRMRASTLRELYIGEAREKKS